MKVAIVAIARLENDYINEWIGHHLGIGVDHIYVYDNSSTEEEKLSGAVFERFLPKVTVVPAYDKKNFQMPAYKEAYGKYGKLYDWLIYIDIDEFIMLQKDETIQELVSRFPSDCECYRMNWEVYGDSGIVNRDVSGSVVGDFRKPSANTKRNTVTKSIVRGGLSNIDFISVHYPVRNIGGKISNLKTYYGDNKDITSKLPVKEKSLNIKAKDYSLVKLNHYITKSISEFICQKMRRPDAAWNYERDMDRDFFQYNEKTEEKTRFHENSKTEIKYYYYSPKNGKFENAGDYFNKILVNKLYNCVMKPVEDEYAHVAFCGSVIPRTELKYAIVAGCGFQNRTKPLNKNPENYFAVRGRLTRERLLENGVDVGDIPFVDPGLLVSRIYGFGKIGKKHRIGIIPHYVDHDTIVEKYGGKYNVISIKTTDVQELCRKISECDIILSSSLHGIIFSHAMGVPAYHIEVSSMQDGDNFKFKDYYSSFDGLEYRCFKCKDGEIPFDDIKEYDSVKRDKANPSAKSVAVKQDEFLSILPFRDFINKKYKSEKFNGKKEVQKPEKTPRLEIKKKTVNKIELLRKEIRSGKIFSMYNGDGNFVWKRVKK